MVINSQDIGHGWNKLLKTRDFQCGLSRLQLTCCASTKASSLPSMSWIANMVSNMDSASGESRAVFAAGDVPSTAFGGVCSCSVATTSAPARA